MTTLASPETALTLACCRWPPSGERDAAVQTAAAAVTNWEEFERLVARHRVAPLAHDGLARSGATLPESVRQRIAARAAERSLATLGMVRESVQLQRAFDEAVLPALILKGCAMGVLAYGDPCLKESSDIDLLTNPEDAAAARALIEGLGYELRDPPALTGPQFARFVRYAIEAVFRHPKTGSVVELHWGLDRNRALLAGLTAHGPSQSVSLAQASMRTFADEELFAYICIHGAKHGWARLKWIADLNAFLSTRQGKPAERLYDAAERLGVERAAGAAMVLCHRLFDCPLPADLLETFNRDRGVRPLVAASLHYIDARLAAGDPGALYPSRLTFTQFFLTPRKAAAIEQLRSMWNHPLELARFGPVAHVWRLPLWLGRRIRGIGARVMPVARRAAP